MLLAATTMTGDDVVNVAAEHLGKIENIMIDTDSGEIGYAVLSFGGTLGIGEKLFAIPWAALQLDTVNRRFVLDVPKERLRQAPGFDKHDWPEANNEVWWQDIGNYWKQHPVIPEAMSQ